MDQDAQKMFDMYVSMLDSKINAAFAPFTTKLDQLTSEVSGLSAQSDKKVADLTAKSTKLLEENNDLLKKNDELSTKVIELTKEVGELNERYAKPVMRGQDGEAQLMQVLRDHFGSWCTIIDTHSSAHSGDIIMEVPRGMDKIRILIDRKNYTGRPTISSEHLNVAIDDAVKNDANAVMIVYTSLPAKCSTGMCYGSEIMSKFTKPFHPDNVMACSLDMVVCAILRLATHTRVFSETPEQAAEMKVLAQDLANTVTSVNQIVAPFLDSMKLKELEQKAIRLQSHVVEFKRHAAAPPYQKEKQALVDALSVFPEGGNKKEYILGGNLTSSLKKIDATGSTSTGSTSDEHAAKKRKLGGE